MTDAPSHFPVNKDGLLHFALVPDLSAEQVILTLNVLSGSQSDDWYEAAVLERETVYNDLEELLDLHGREGCINYKHGGWCDSCEKHYKRMAGQHLRQRMRRIEDDPLWQESKYEESGFDPLEYEALSVLRNRSTN